MTMYNYKAILRLLFISVPPPKKKTYLNLQSIFS